MTRAPFEIAGHAIAPGMRADLELPVARLVTQNMVHLPVSVLHGAEEGPALFLTAAIHGDELNGTEVARRILERVDPKGLRGTLIVLPVVNVLGFIQGTRYLPDRRDLNRQFPGSAKGSLASQLAHLVMQEVVARCTHGIDLHGGSHHRTNLPQIRGDLDHPGTAALAQAFAAPVTVHARQRPGSLRGTAAKGGIPVLVYEAGEPQRFEEPAIRHGVEGVERILAHLGMRDLPGALTSARTVVCRSTTWMRSTRSGIARIHVDVGEQVAKGQVLAEVGDAFGTREAVLKARADGIVIGRSVNPIVNRGDALVNIAIPHA